MGTVATVSNLIIYTRTTNNKVSIKSFDILLGVAEVSKDNGLSLELTLKTDRELKKYLEIINDNMDSYQEISINIGGETIPIFTKNIKKIKNN